MRLQRIDGARWGIVAATFIVMSGAGSIFPILPLFLGEHGASFALTGVVVSANLVGTFVGQYPAGWLADRIGRRPVMVGGLVTAAAFTLAMVLPVGIGWLIGFRFLAGLGGAAYFPASRAMIADLVPESERGRAYGWLSSARLAGFIAGPAIGGVLALGGRQTVFVATAVALLLAAVVIVVALRSTPAARPSPRLGEEAVAAPPGPAGPAPSRLAWAFAGLLALSVGFGVVVGAYTTVWSLFLKAIGATDWQIGLSLSLFALPAVVVAPLAGVAADRWSRRWLACGAVALAGIVAMIYPLFTSVPPVIALGVLEGAGIAFFDPASNALLMESVPADRRGRFQGGLGAANSAAMASGAAAGGVLFGFGVGVPFWVTGSICIALSAAGAILLGQAGADRASPLEIGSPPTRTRSA